MTREDLQERLMQAMEGDIAARIANSGDDLQIRVKDASGDEWLLLARWQAVRGPFAEFEE